MIYGGSFLRLALSTLITVLFLTIITSCSKEIPPLPLPTVIVAPVVEKAIFPTVDFVGEAIAEENVSLMARVTGFLVKKNFGDGSYVKKGDIVFVIEKEQYIADAEAAKAAVLSAEADYQNALIEYNRESKLKATNAVSQREYDKAVQAKYSSEGSFLSAKAKLRNAELNLNYTDVCAPCDGKLGAAKYDVGNLVGPSSNPLTLLTKLDPIKIQFSISEALLVTALQKDKKDPAEGATNINETLKNQNVVPRLILSNGTEYPYPGEIYFVDNTINEMTGTINLRALFPNPKHIILPGAYVKVKLSQSNPTKCLLVPQKAVQESQSGNFVYVINKNNKVELHNITTLDMYNTDYIVSEGVKAGDTIVIEGLQKVKPGMTVNPLTENDMKKQAKEQPKK